jgi:hypothetical protein
MAANNPVFSGDSTYVKVINGMATVYKGEKVPVFNGVTEVAYDGNGFLEYTVPVAKAMNEKEIMALADELVKFSEKNYLKKAKFRKEVTPNKMSFVANERIGGIMFVFNVVVRMKKNKIDFAAIQKYGVEFWRVQDYDKKFKD